jgi:hypothetical protein
VTIRERLSDRLLKLLEHVRLGFEELAIISLRHDQRHRSVHGIELTVAGRASNNWGSFNDYRSCRFCFFRRDGSAQSRLGPFPSPLLALVASLCEVDDVGQIMAKNHWPQRRRSSEEQH